MSDGPMDASPRHTASIRLLTPADEPFLREALYHAIYAEPGETVPRSIVRQPDLARYVGGWMRRSTDLGFVAEMGWEAIGAAWLRCWSGNDRGYGFVDEATPELSMSLLPPFRGQGLGTRLLRRLLSAASRRFEAVSLSVSTANPALRLYAREGFVAVGEPKDGSAVMLLRFEVSPSRAVSHRSRAEPSSVFEGGFDR